MIEGYSYQAWSKITRTLSGERFILWANRESSWQIMPGCHLGPWLLSSLFWNESLMVRFKHVNCEGNPLLATAIIISGASARPLLCAHARFCGPCVCEHTRNRAGAKSAKFVTMLLMWRITNIIAQNHWLQPAWQKALRCQYLRSEQALSEESEALEGGNG